MNNFIEWDVQYSCLYINHLASQKILVRYDDGSQNDVTTMYIEHMFNKTVIENTLVGGFEKYFLLKCPDSRCHLVSD